MSWRCAGCGSSSEVGLLGDGVQPPPLPPHPPPPAGNVSSPTLSSHSWTVVSAALNDLPLYYLLAFSQNKLCQNCINLMKMSNVPKYLVIVSSVFAITLTKITSPALHITLSMTDGHHRWLVLQFWVTVTCPSLEGKGLS